MGQGRILLDGMTDGTEVRHSFVPQHTFNLSTEWMKRRLHHRLPLNSTRSSPLFTTLMGSTVTRYITRTQQARGPSAWAFPFVYWVDGLAIGSSTTEIAV